MRRFLRLKVATAMAAQWWREICEMERTTTVFRFNSEETLREVFFKLERESVTPELIRKSNAPSHAF